MRTFVQQQNGRQGHVVTSSKSHAAIAKSALPNFFQDRQSFDKGNRFGFDFSRIPIYPSAQAKLAIGSLSDSCEQEAYRVSEQVGSMAEPYLQPTNGRGTNYFEEHKQKRGQAGERLQMSSTGSRSLEEAAAPSVAGEALLSPGRPIDCETRAFMEPIFGHYFSQVRLHADEKAAESSRALHARAYTVGRDIVFAAGHYAPGTLFGMSPLGHELTHVVQQTREPSPVLRRAPAPDALGEYKTTQKVWDNDAKAIDLSIAQSPTIAKYPPKKPKKESGNVDTEDKAVFASQYATYAKGLGEKPAEIEEDLKTVAGFTDRKTGQIHLLNHIADVEVALHEAIHLNSDAQFQNNFGHHLNEGVTEHFTQVVLKEQKRDPGKAYPDELAMAEGLISDLGEDQVGQAYFQGKLDAYRRVLSGFSGGKDPAAFQTWHGRVTSSDHKDWKEATTQLHAASSHP